MSPRAACRLETLGFDRVYDYAGGKADWVAAGERVDGEVEGPPPAMRVLRTDVVTCRLDDPVSDVAAQLSASEIPFAVVIDDGGYVLGKVRRRDVEYVEDDSLTAGDVLVEGPTSTRADVDLADMLHRMDHASTRTVLVTTGQGELLGVLVRDDLEGLHGHHGHHPGA